MRICFVTGTLEPGRDGVGDFTRNLADACRERGHETVAIGLNDRWLEQDSVQEMDFTRNGSILRMSSGLSWRERFRSACKAVKEFSPDWLSLQFVPYAFHGRGLCRSFVLGFPAMVGPARVQILFHGIWIGEYPGAPLTERLTGFLQKRIIRRLLENTQPSLVHYSNAGSLVRLRSVYSPLEYLPIFGNIRPGKERAGEWFYRKLEAEGAMEADTGRSDYWIFGFFGVLHSGWDPEALFFRIEEEAKRKGKRVVMVSIGRLGKGRWEWEKLGLRYGQRFAFCEFGEQPESRISQFLNTVDYGVTSTPFDIIGKSSSVAAMLEHGLPVLVSDEGGTPGAPLVVRDSHLPLIHRVDDSLSGLLSKGIPRAKAEAGVAGVAETFLGQLERRESLGARS